MTDLGFLHYCLGVEVWQTGGSIFISQSKHACSLLDKFQMQDCKLVSTTMEQGLKLATKYNSLVVSESTFRQLVGSAIYLIATRPDLSFAMSYISCFMTAPKADHWVATKCVLRYVKGTFDFGILYSTSHDPRLIGFTDSDWVGFTNDKKSTSGYVFNLGSGAVT
ncbi:secreted RxLR effector protein 161-like [Cryptomeria japonica]|uniref:secreted RxLR effector protein 161-like n=1 Tax=Cryptomeria japonica TaxID=3369 RepID=UPI0025ABADEF|nr:secreted RxLR effector protein 161-like [Cryptomeria japonica]